MLLILAVVSIGAIKNSKIISHSQNAANKWKEEQENENELLEGYLGKIESSLPKTPISTTDTYIGYYADIDDDGTVDGIIYADLAFDNSGYWYYYGEGTYSYSKKDTLNNYYISQESYKANEGFGNKPVIAPIDLAKDTVEDNNRFYVMALEDFTTEDYKSFYWYYNAYKKMSDYATTTSTDFETGKQNTATMMTKVYGAGLKDRDIWKYINSEVERGWFIPSKEEWGAFADSQKITNSNKGTYGLSGGYWSSSQRNNGEAYYLDIRYLEGDGHYTVRTNNGVRLSTTF